MPMVAEATDSLQTAAELIVTPARGLRVFKGVTVSSELKAGMVFLLAKYGLGFNLGVKKLGISVGGELGTGARLASGYLNLASTIGGESGAYAYNIRSDFNSILDAAIKAGLRLGQSFRAIDQKAPCQLMQKSI